MAAESILLVEGEDDSKVVGNLLYAHGLDQTLQIKPQGGVSLLLRELPVWAKESELRRLGIVVDANSDPAPPWQSIRDTLISMGYEAPTEMKPNGIVLATEDRPAIGIWLMPSNTSPGMLEDFVLSMIANTDPLLPRARTCVGEIPPEHRRFAPQHRSKAIVHTWFAWQEEPGKPMGAGFSRRYLDSRCEPAMAFIGWIRLLLQQGPSY